MPSLLSRLPSGGGMFHLLRSRPLPVDLRLGISLRRVFSVHTRATLSGLTNYAERFSDVMPRRTLPLTQWPLPVVSFGLDDYGSSAPDRAGRLYSSVVKKGCNLLFFDGDVLLQRGDPSSEYYTRRPFELSWEASTLNRLLSSGDVDRSELAVGVRLALGRVGPASPSSPAGGVVSPKDLEDRIERVRKGLRLSALDILLLHLPAGRHAASDVVVRETIATAESLVRGGLIQAYGLACDKWLVGSDGSSSSGHGSNSSHPPQGTQLQVIGQPLERILEMAIPPSLSSEGWGAGNGQARKRLAGGASHLAFIGYPASLSTASGVFIPPLSSTKPDGGVRGGGEALARSPSSVASVAHSYGAMSLLLSPLDAIVSIASSSQQQKQKGGPGQTPSTNQNTVPSATSSSSSFSSSSSSPSSSSSSAIRPLRCTSSSSAMNACASHPARSAALLNDIMNFAIHCEIMWEREVRASVEADEVLRDKVGLGASADVSSGGDSGGGSDNSLFKKSAVDGSSLVESDPSSAGTATPSSSSAGDFMNMTLVQNRLVDSENGLPVEEDGGAGGGAHSAIRISSVSRADVAWARSLASQLGRFQNLDLGPPFTLLEWRYIRSRKIAPSLDRLSGAAGSCIDAKQWLRGYRMLMAQLLARMDAIVEQQHEFSAAYLASMLRVAVPELGSPSPLYMALFGEKLVNSPSSTSASFLPLDTTQGSPTAPALPTPPPAASAIEEALHSASSSLTNDVLRCLLAAPGSIAVSEVGDAFGLVKTKRLGTQHQASKQQAGAEPTSGLEDGAAAKSISQRGLGGLAKNAVLGTAPSTLVLPPFRAVQRALLAGVPGSLAMAVQAPPRCDWKDPLEGVPTQAELGPVRDAIRGLGGGGAPLNKSQR